jgi:hypothetical protein
VLFQSGHRAARKGRAGRDQQMLVRDTASAGKVHTPGVRVDAVHPCALERDRPAREDLLDGQGRCRGIGAERHVDQVGSEHEVTVVADHVQVDAAREPPREQERRLQAGDSGTDDDDTWRWRVHCGSRPLIRDGSTAFTTSAWDRAE